MLLYYFQLIKNNINRQKNVLTKSCDVDLVTETDRQVEKLLMDGISAKFPDHKYDMRINNNSIIIIKFFF